MTFTPKTWECGDTITADELNRMERGIADAGSGGGTASEPIVGYFSTDDRITFTDSEFHMETFTLTEANFYLLSDAIGASEQMPPTPLTINEVKTAIENGSEASGVFSILDDSNNRLIDVPLHLCTSAYAEGGVIGLEGATMGTFPPFSSHNGTGYAVCATVFLADEGQVNIVYVADVISK